MITHDSMSSLTVIMRIYVQEFFTSIKELYLLQKSCLSKVSTESFFKYTVVGLFK